MADHDGNGGAWIETPSSYWARRPAPCRTPAAPVSRYVTMHDGCRIALDAWGRTLTGILAGKAGGTVVPFGGGGGRERKAC